ncbi:hypothetical protein MKW98_021782 [Papaver atlanticum]|uniref:Cation efflux protein transmembrane domain-containing protein n=1 Tax=Papaver atlanticum TaxID=357466 RepID=A0AAD4RW23_9MAGN|nr:hypothetical protein MKW98_006433 [Papaver atlanticum]KAI3943180.1 hypothetical protein MKW98_021782 [Papaver atlanticum]
MEVQDAQPRHIIEISRDVISEGSSHGTTKIYAKERAASMRKLWISIALCVVFMTVEIVGGVKANSLAILTDAAHLLSDVAAFWISLFSLWASSWEATPRQSYGFFRIEILGTLVSIQMIWLLSGILVYEAIARMINDTGEVQGFLMFLVSAFGLVVNLVMAVLVGHDHGHGGHGRDHGHGHNHSHDPLLKSSEDSTIIVGKENKKRNINILGSYLHVLGDSIQKWNKIDLICTLIFSIIVLGTTIRMLRNIMEVLMESTPREIDVTMLAKDLCEIEEAIAIHELHIWAITVGKVP